MNFQLRPQFFDERSSRVSLIIQGPVQDEIPRVSAFIDLTRGGFVSGKTVEPLQIHLPKGFTLAQNPPRVPFELVPADFIPGGLKSP